MSLITRQDALVAKLEPIYRQYLQQGWIGSALAGQRSKAKRLHAEEMMGCGYTKDEAWASAKQCDQVAQLNASHADYLTSMGVPA